MPLFDAFQKYTKNQGIKEWRSQIMNDSMNGIPFFGKEWKVNGVQKFGERLNERPFINTFR